MKAKYGKKEIYKQWHLHLRGLIQLMMSVKDDLSQLQDYYFKDEDVGRVTMTG